MNFTQPTRAQLEADGSPVVEHWLELHFLAGIVSALSTMIAEVLVFAMYTIFDVSTINISAFEYVRLHMFIPSIYFAIALALAYIAINSEAPQIVKAGVCSMMGVMIAAVIYLCHSRWQSVDMTLAIPIMATVGYSSVGVTSLTAGAVIGMKTYSDFFLLGSYIPYSYPRITAHPDSLIDFVLSISLLSVTWILAILFIQCERGRLRDTDRQERMRLAHFAKSMVDGETGAGNRLALRYAFDEMLQDGSGASFAAAIIDVSQRDMVAKAVKLLSSIRRARVYRYGDQQLCMLLSGADQADVIDVFDRSRMELTSVGGASMTMGMAYRTGGESPSGLMKMATLAIEKARSERRSIVIYDDVLFGASKANGSAAS